MIFIDYVARTKNLIMPEKVAYFQCQKFLGAIIKQKESQVFENNTTYRCKISYGVFRQDFFMFATIAFTNKMYFQLYHPCYLNCGSPGIKDILANLKSLHRIYL